VTVDRSGKIGEANWVAARALRRSALKHAEKLAPQYFLVSHATGLSSASRNVQRKTTPLLLKMAKESQAKK
jgi:hypothetical protein